MINIRKTLKGVGRRKKNHKILYPKQIILLPAGYRAGFGISSTGNGRARTCPVFEIRVTGKGFSQIARFLAHGTMGL